MANIHYPSNEITPHGWYHLIKGTQPDLALKAYDESVEMYLMGGRSIPDRYLSPESVQVPRDGLKGLIPPWQHIDQKGATQDGTTQLDALLDPIEVELDAVCRGRDAKHTREVVRRLIGSLDAIKESELGFLTQDWGYWWAKVRWLNGAPPDPLAGAQQRRQKLALRLRADTGLWRTYADTAAFGFAYEDMIDTFNIDYSDEQDLGPNWPQYYTGSGAGYCSTINTSGVFTFNQARWYESGNDELTVVNGPYKDFETATDNQVINMVLGTHPHITWIDGSWNDLWGRMSRDGSGNWLGDGIRARIGVQGLFAWVKLSRFNNFVETPMKDRILLRHPKMGDKYTLVCGDEDNDRQFEIQRNGITILSHKEIGTGSELGPDYRGIGFGMEAGAGIAQQARPAWVRKISAGDNALISQEGFLPRLNIGDQKMYDDYIVFGPGIVKIWDGPDSVDDYVQFGPLVANQVMFLRTDPRDPGVQDLTAVAPTPQDILLFQEAFEKWSSFAFNNNVAPLTTTAESQFGIVSPQGNPYVLLNGRFSDASAIPPMSPGDPLKTYHVKVAIDNGNANSKIIASGVPQRRWPL